ncbi:MAG: hypothetical protein KGI08_03285 [Thaumarchaeota archaeon]|nr:hypothetical protein [Nitrososphaerota archaeon]
MSTIADEILEARGVQYEDLSAAEKETYYKWLNDLQASQVTLDKVINHVRTMKNAIELELVSTDPYTYFLWFKIPNLKHEHLKARLHNYLLLDSLFNEPERAKQLLEQYKRTPIK